MGTAVRLSGIVAALALVFATAWWVGAVSAPLPRPASPPAAPPTTAPARPAADRVAFVDGYRVRLDGELVPGAPSQVFATVTAAGAAVTDLEPHLGGFGHLVVLRLDDLSLVQVRPDAPWPAPTDRSGPGISFTADVPSSGSYRLYLEFRHAGAVHTATFTVPVQERQ
jgi:hypothetical protein